MFDDGLEFLEVVDELTGDTYFYELEMNTDSSYVYSGLELEPEEVHPPLELDWSSF